MNTPDVPPLADVGSLDLDAAGVTTVLWATRLPSRVPLAHGPGERRRRRAHPTLRRHARPVHPRPALRTPPLLPHHRRCRPRRQVARSTHPRGSLRSFGSFCARAARGSGMRSVRAGARLRAPHRMSRALGLLLDWPVFGIRGSSRPCCLSGRRSSWRKPHGSCSPSVPLCEKMRTSERTESTGHERAQQARSPRAQGADEPSA